MQQEKYTAKSMIPVMQRYFSSFFEMYCQRARMARVLRFWITYASPCKASSRISKGKERLKLVFLPPYSPNLNLIEGLWKWLKEKVIYNVFYKTVPEIRKNVNAFLKVISSEPETVIQRLCCKL